MMKTGRVLGWALMCLLASPLALAQTDNLAVVCSGTGCANFAGIPTSQIFDNIADAMTYLTPLSKSAHCTLFIAPGTYSLGTGIVIDSTMDLEIIGTSVGAVDDPTAVVLQGGVGNYGIELNGAADTVVIEGVTIAGAKGGVWAHNSSKGTIARCFIHDSAANGILIESSDLFIANCSLKANAKDGVNISGAGAKGEIYFCTIYSNVEHGVYADAASSGTTVQDCIVYQNGVAGAAADAGGIVGASAAVYTLVDTNDSVGNKTGADYVPASLGTNPVSAAPAFDTAFTWGALDGLDTSNVNNIIGHAVTPSVSSDKKRFISVDFQNQGRPAVWPVPGGSSDSDIGADEVSTSGGIPLWDYCYVATNPIPKMVAGTLSIQLRFSGNSPVLATGDAIIVPQGSTTAAEYSGVTGTPHIPLKVVAPNPVPSGGSSFYILTNANDITTSLGAAASTAGPSATDVIADGHGVVHVRVSGTEIPSANVIGQAVTGRHVLIDTTPPVMVISSPSGLAAPSFVQYVTPLTSVGPPAIPDGNHVGVPALPGGWRAFAAPSYDDGLIFPTPTTYNGAQAFFNPGSISNGYLAANGNPSQRNNLNVRVSITIQDYAPRDITTGNEILGTDETYSPTVAVHRQVAGFGNPLPTNKTQESIDTALTGTPGPDGRLVDWVFDAGALPATTTVNTTYSAAGGTNVGYVPETGATQDFNNSRMSVSWTFDDPVYPYAAGAPTGIPYSGADLHLSVRFRVRDASNSSTLQTRLLDPLHLWWMLSTRARIQPNREGTEVSQPDFSWALDRGTSTRAAGQPQPLFTYRLWENLDGNYDGEFVPVTGWSAWTTLNRLSAADFSSLLGVNVLKDHADRWLLLAVLGADEAGNVEPWPALTGLAMNAQSHLLAGNPSGANWQRFYLKGTNANVYDTTIQPTFWWDNLSSLDSLDAGELLAGQGPIVASPPDLTLQRLAAVFRINVIGPFYANRYIHWELVREDESNKIVSNPDLPLNNPLSYRDLVVPDGMSDTGVANHRVFDFVTIGSTTYLELGDANANPEARRPVNYILRAWSYADFNGNAQWDRASEPGDATPATLKFTVVPKVSDYIQNKNNADFQPVKVQEDK